MEEWAELSEFPDYGVSTFGNIINMRSGAPRKASVNQQGIVKISLYQDHNTLHTRSVALLVAEAFLPRPYDHFDTPIHLDGDRLNCRVDNLMWRPRWFAIKYHKQFQFDVFHNDRVHRIDIDTGNHYYSMKEVCTTNGVYWFDVFKSCLQGEETDITRQQFRRAEDVDM